MPITGDFAKIKKFGQQVEGLTPEAVAQQAAPRVEAALKERIRAYPWPNRRDGSASTIPMLAEHVRVEARGGSLVMRVESEGADFVQSGTSRMPARHILPEGEEAIALLRPLLEAAMAEVFQKGK